MIIYNIYIYICMNVCMHACMHVCMYVCVLIYIYGRVWINGIIMPWISPPVSSNMGWFMYLLMAWLPLMNWTEHCFLFYKHGRDWNDRIRKRTFAQSSRWNAFGWSSSGNRFSCWQTMFWKSTGHISIPKNASTINKSPWDSTVQEKNRRRQTCSEGDGDRDT